LAADDAGAEDQRDDAELDDLVDAHKAFGFDEDAGLLIDLAAYAVVDGLVQFEDAAGDLPVAIVAALHDEDPVVVGDDGGGADAVAGGSGHGWSSSNWHRAALASSWRL
jgi:hypothetical protein